MVSWFLLVPAMVFELKINPALPHNGILFCHRKESSTVAWDNVHEPQKGTTKGKKPDMNGHKRFHFYEISRMGQSTEIGNRTVASRGWEGGAKEE